MNDQKGAADAEFAAMHTVYSVLEPLDDDARRRIVNYVVARLEIDGQATPASGGNQNIAEAPASDDAALLNEKAAAPKCGSFAELFDAASPKSSADKALVAGYWLQVCQNADSFDGFSANKELKNLGQGLPNITNAIEALKTQQPALALQLKKSGTSQQARKTYKLTIAGIKAVDAMPRG